MRCKYDYTSFALSGLDLADSIKNKTYRLVNGNTLTDTVLTWPPVYLAGPQLLLNDFMLYFRLRDVDRNKDTWGKTRILVSFTVDQYGNTSNHHIKQPIDASMAREVIRVYKLMPDYWLPGILNDQPVDVEVDWPISFQF